MRVKFQIISINENCVELACNASLDAFFPRYCRHSSLTEAIKKIDGVENAHILNRYTIELCKGRCFTWEKIIPKVGRIIKSFVDGSIAVKEAKQIINNQLIQESIKDVIN